VAGKESYGEEGGDGSIYQVQNILNELDVLFF
jgi:hypothetical protein